MNVFVEEDEEATIDCTAWPRVKISCTTIGGGNAGCIATVEVRID